MAKEIKMQGQQQPADDERQQTGKDLANKMIGLMTEEERITFNEYYNAIAETMGKVEEYGKKSELITDEEFGHIVYAKQYFRQMADIIESASDEKAQE